MEFKSLITVYFAVIWSHGVLSKYEESDAELKNDIKQSFAKLLKLLLDVNEERLAAMMKYAQLQDYVLTKHQLRTANNRFNDDDHIQFSWTWRNVLSRKGESDADLKNDIKQSFAKLVKGIVNVNKQRLAAMKKYIELEDYIQTRNVDDDEHIPISWRFPLPRNDDPPNKRTKNEFIRNNQNGADRSGANPIPLCTIACYKTMKNLCKTHKCVRKVKENEITMIIDNCRRNCVTELGFGIW